MAKDSVTIKERESKTDIAYRLLSKRKKERNFYDLWEDVKAELAKVIDPEEFASIDEDISFFYTNLTLDGRFVHVGDNKWNLRERVKYEKVHIDMSEIYQEEESDEVDSEEEDEIKDTYSNDDFDDYSETDSDDSDINQYRKQKVNDDYDE